MHSKKITRISRLLKWCAISICLGLPLFEAGYWITHGYPFLSPFVHFNDVMWGSGGDDTIVWSKINDLQKFLGFLISMIPAAFSMAALWFLSQVFASFERVELFEKRNVQILKKAGLAIVYGQIAYPFYVAALSLAMTYRNQVGERTLSVAFGSDQFKILAIGLSILLISWVFEEAVKLREEQEATV